MRGCSCAWVGAWVGLWGEHGWLHRVSSGSNPLVGRETLVNKEMFLAGSCVSVSNSGESQYHSPQPPFLLSSLLCVRFFGVRDTR
jgi:hypothetical protein